MVLEVTNINVYYGKSHVIHDVSLRVEQGEIVGLLGRNGVGKTTLLRSIIGLNPPRSGTIRYRNEHINGLPPHRIIRKGISWVPQERGVFDNLSVYQNLRLAAEAGKQDLESLLSEILNFFPTLKDRLNQSAGSLSGGERKMLSIARSLMSGPDLLLLDEPTEGLQPSIVDEVGRIAQRLNRERKISQILVGQNVDFVFALANRCHFMVKGQIVETGTPAELEGVWKKYLAI